MLAEPQEGTKRRDRKSTLWNGFKILLAAILLAVVVSKVRSQDLTDTVQNLAPGWLPVALLVYLLGILAGARRYWLLNGRRPSFRQTLSIVIVQSVIGNILATVAGAVSYMALLKGRHQVGVAQGLFSLLAARVYDLAVLVGLLAVVSFTFWGTIQPLHWPVILLLVILGPMALALVVLLAFRRRLLEPADRFLTWIGLKRFGWIQRGWDAISKALGDPASTRAQAGTVSLLAHSLAILLLSFVLFLATARLFGLTIGPGPLLFVFVLTQLIMVVPIQVFGGLGVAEVSILYLCGLFGGSPHEIAPVVLGMRVTLYALTSLMLLYLPLETLLTRSQTRPDKE